MWVYEPLNRSIGEIQGREDANHHIAEKLSTDNGSRFLIEGAEILKA